LEKSDRKKALAAYKGRGEAISRSSPNRDRLKKRVRSIIQDSLARISSVPFKKKSRVSTEKAFPPRSLIVSLIVKKGGPISLKGGVELPSVRSEFFTTKRRFRP